MPAHRIGAVPMTPAERQAAPARSGPAASPGAAPPATAAAMGGSGSDPDRSAGRVPCLVRQPPDQPRKLEAGRKAASHLRDRPRRATGNRSTARLRPRLIRRSSSPDTTIKIAELDGHNTTHPFSALEYTHSMRQHCWCVPQIWCDATRHAGRMARKLDA